MKSMPFIKNKLGLNSSTEVKNPYIKGAEGRKEWNDRYMNMSKAIRNWQIMSLCLMGIVILFAVMMTKMASESRVEPFVVETNNGMPYAIKPMSSLSTQDQRLINFAINQFIINARTVINDTQAQKVLLNKVYAFSANNTINTLHDYYDKNNPFTVASQYSVSINIINSLPISHDTWQVVWDETKRAVNSGASLETTRWMANVSYKFGDVNAKFAMDNPFGLYITQVSWSQSQID